PEPVCRSQPFMFVPMFAIFAFISFSPSVTPVSSAVLIVSLLVVDGVLPGPIPIVANLVKS
ncbi:MAG: hypothetical protein WAM14_07145, partial [Candidatus Nitrosopolaris sp.]